MMQMSAPNKRPVIVILGMHRCGTSLISNFLHEIGVDFGNDLAHPDEFNARGYWESLTIRDIQDKILEEMNCDCFCPPVSIPDNWQCNDSIRKLKNDLKEFVRAECSRTEKIWGFKDPRTCILLPVWREIFEELQVEPLYILAFRHPASVAASLDRRNHMERAHCEALWLKHYLDVLSNVGDNWKAIVDYDRWFDSGAEQARLVAQSLKPYATMTDSQIDQAFDRVISNQLRHHGNLEKLIQSPLVEKFYSLLCVAATNQRVPVEALDLVKKYQGSMFFLDMTHELAKGHGSSIAKGNRKILKLKRQRKLLAWALILVCTLFFAISAMFH
jgi:hypothetical protein